MRTDIYWLADQWPGRIAVAPRPRGDEWTAEDLARWKGEGVDIVVSLLTPEEQRDLGLGDEAREMRAAKIDFISFPIPDLQVPTSKAQLADVIDRIGAGLAAGRNVLIHCRQGIGRSGLVAACLLVSKGLSPGAAIEQVSAARGLPVPETPEQRDWIDRYAAVSASAK